MEDKNLKGFVNEKINTEGLSADFTSKLMDKINLENSKESIVQPLVSKKQWTFVGIVFAAILVMASLNDLSQIEMPEFSRVVSSFNSFIESFKTTIITGISLSIILALLFGTDLCVRYYKKRKLSI